MTDPTNNLTSGYTSKENKNRISEIGHKKKKKVYFKQDLVLKLSFRTQHGRIINSEKTIHFINTNPALKKLNRLDYVQKVL